MESGTQWRWVDRKGVQRTLTAEALHQALRAGVLGRDVPVWQQGMDAFEPVHRVPEFAASSRSAPPSTPADVAPVGTVVATTAEAQQALQTMVARERSRRGPAHGRPDPATVPPPRAPVQRSVGPDTVPPPRCGKPTVRLGSPSPLQPQAPQPPQAPLPPRPVAPSARPPVREALPPPPQPEAKTSREAMTIGVGMDAPPVPSLSNDQDASLREDTPPATPLALTASGRRSSSPKQLDPGQAQAPEPIVPPAAPAPLPAQPAESPRNVPTIPPSRMDKTQPSAAMRAEFERQLAREKRMRILLPVLGGIGGIIAVVMMGLVIWAVVSSGEPDPGTPAASIAASASASAPVAASTTLAVPTEPVQPAKACVYRGPRKRLVIGASKDVPLEVWSAPDQRELAVGFAARNFTALAFVLDPRSVSPQRSYSKKVAAPIHRVVPVPSGKSIGFETNAEDPSASVRHPLTVPTSPPVRLGTFKNSLTISVEGQSVPEILWQLPFTGEVEAMRTAVVPGKGFGLVFRATDALWFGWVTEASKPLGELTKIPGTGVKVGTPSMGWNGREALITFANLDAPRAPWNVRMARVQYGRPAASSFEWAVPKGGPGGAAIAPTIFGMHDGRWVMVWTEGKSGSRSVRVQTYDAQMVAVGEAFTVSRPGSNAGQGMAVVGSDGGAVFYLAVIGTQYEVWGAGIECP
ncbi:MAG: GYF domain-containing protein [Myxococcota bacterium]